MLCCELGDGIWNTQQPSGSGEGGGVQLEKEQVSAGVSTVGHSTCECLGVSKYP